MTNIKLIIFDWDDVFTLGSKEGYFRCYRETLEELGVNLGPEEEKRRILARWGQPHTEELKLLLQERPELYEKSCDIYASKLYGNTYVDCLSIVPGSLELLNRLNERYILTVATGLDSKIMRSHVIPRFNVPDVFLDIISTYDLEDPAKHKPSAWIPEMLMEKHGCSPQQTLVAGDAANDIKMGYAAGTEAVAVMTGHLSRQEAEELGVKYIIDDITGIEAVLKKLNS